MGNNDLQWLHWCFWADWSRDTSVCVSLSVCLFVCVDLVNNSLGVFGQSASHSSQHLRMVNKLSWALTSHTSTHTYSRPPPVWDNAASTIRPFHSNTTIYSDHSGHRLGLRMNVKSMRTESKLTQHFCIYWMQSVPTGLNLASCFVLFIILLCILKKVGGSPKHPSVCLGAVSKKMLDVVLHNTIKIWLENYIDIYHDIHSPATLLDTLC